MTRRNHLHLQPPTPVLEQAAAIVDENDKQTRFLEGYNKLVKETGFQFVAQAQAETLGPVLQIRAALAIAPVEEK